MLEAMLSKRTSRTMPDRFRTALHLEKKEQAGLTKSRWLPTSLPVLRNCPASHVHFLFGKPTCRTCRMHMRKQVTGVRTCNCVAQPGAPS